MKKFLTLLPGFCLVLLISLSARWLESLLALPWIGESLIALFIGMSISHGAKASTTMQPGIQFTSKRVLKFSIVLLGASLSVGTIISTGRLSLTILLFTFLAAFGGGHFISRRLNLDWKLSNMISAGMGICGGSAIAAMAPAIEAEDGDIAYAISATFLFDVAMMILFPLMGRFLGLNDMAYGFWAGTAVNNTASVVAAGYAFSEAAGDFATMVKLTRTLFIIPVVFIFSLINARQNFKKGQAGAHQAKIKTGALIPWFMLAFMGMSLLNSIGLIPAALALVLKSISKFFMVCALAAIGLNTSLSDMKKSGINPMIYAFIISSLVVLVAIGVEFCMGLV